MTMNNSYNTPIFDEIWEDEDAFLEDYESASLQALSTEDALITYNLLDAEFSAAPIAGHTIDLFKKRLFSTMYQYGPV